MTAFIILLIVVNLVGTSLLLWLHSSREVAYRRNLCDMCGAHQREMHQYGAARVCDRCNEFLRRNDVR